MSPRPERPRIPNALVIAGGLFSAAIVLAALVGLGLAAANNSEPGTVALEQRAVDRDENDTPAPTTTERQRPPTTTTTAPTTTTTAPPPPPPPPPTAPPTTQEATQSDCHPSYEGTCIPPDVEDADCAGGGGNGPWYVQEKNIRLVEPDVFDLDHDKGGIGCEA